MLIHKACCYLVLFSILLLPYCLLLLLLFTVSISSLCTHNTYTGAWYTMLCSWGRDD